MAYQNAQTKGLGRSILLRTCLGIVAFSVGYIILLYLFIQYFVPPLSNFVYNGLLGGTNYTVYDTLVGLVWMLIFACYAAGLALIIYFGIRRSLRYFDGLLASIENILKKEDAPIMLPQELSQTALALTQIRETNRHNEVTARAAEQRKNELVVYLAHDIKTPLTSIVGYLSMLEESPDMPLESRARYSGIALEKAYRLEELMDEFFEITRYNLQTIPIERANFDAVLFCQQVIDDLYPQAIKHSLTITLKPTTELMVFADANRLSRVLNNVVKNAVSYADESTEVRVEVEKCIVRETEHWLRISVTNQGREISPEHLNRLFESFYRGDDARSSLSGGSGLGLSISREIARAHGGEIYATSVNGVTCFTIWIPQP